jgi:hypothetical protein
MSLSDAQILAVWEAGRSQHPLDRALTMLLAGAGAAGEDQGAHPTRAELARLPIGQRDARLLDLREQTFGPTFNAVARCLSCAQEIEFSLRTADMKVSQPAAGDADDIPKTQLEHDGWRVRFRALDSRDLSHAVAAADREAGVRILLERCVLAAERIAPDVADDVKEIPASVRNRVQQWLAELDPQSQVMLALRCPHCDAAWQAPFDIAGFFWDELSAQARRLLREVHVLASAYGWSEAEILALGAARRAAYIDLVGA